MTHKQSITGWPVPCSNGTGVNDLEGGLISPCCMMAEMAPRSGGHRGSAAATPALRSPSFHGYL